MGSKDTTRMTAHMESDTITIVELNNLHNVPNPLKRNYTLEDSDSAREKILSNCEKKQRRDTIKEQGVHQELKLYQEQEVHPEQKDHQGQEVHQEQDNIHKEQEGYSKQKQPDHSIYACEGDCPYIIPVTRDLEVKDKSYLKWVREQISYHTFDKAHREQAVSAASHKFNFEHYYKFKKESQQFSCNFYIDHYLVCSVKAPTETKAHSKSVNVGLDNLEKCVRITKKQKQIEKHNKLSKNVHLEQEHQKQNVNIEQKHQKQNVNIEQDHQKQNVNIEQDHQKQNVNIEQELRLKTTELIPAVSYGVEKIVNAIELETSNQEDLKSKFLANSFPQRFVLIYHSEGGTPEKILNDSAYFSDLKLNFRNEKKVVPKSSKQKIFSVILGGEVCVTGVGRNKMDARAEAATAALKFLKTFIYSIKVKNQNHGFGITRDQLRGSSFYKPIPDDNIGAKMMKMMGWSGGSIGKVGSTGIIEPILCDNTQMYREGLGFSNDKKILKTFNGAAYDFIRDYAQSDSLNDLVFSDEFSSDERMTIRGIAKQFKLITDNKGKRDISQIVISRRCEVETLLNHLKQVGFTSKYELISPSPAMNAVNMNAAMNAVNY